MNTPDNTTKNEKKTFEITLTPGRQERQWLRQSLAALYEDEWFTDILYRVKGGKEATVYCCRGGPGADADLVAAKVFRPRVFRAMRNDALYKRGRSMVDPSDRKHLKRRHHVALQKKSKFGRRLDTAAWIDHEYQTLIEFHAAGADVPRPIVAAPNAFLMEYVGDEHQAAPILHAVRLDREEAESIYERLIRNVKLFLSHYRIHADLSAYNVLYWQGEVRVIDFPQTIDATTHPDAFELLVRDLDRLCRYFRRQGVDCDPEGLAMDLWDRWVC